jgi:glycosyltransferase involved in cell wall biosynthesis
MAMPEILEQIDARLVIAGEFWEGKDSYLRLIDELKIGNKVTVIDRYIPNEEMPTFFYATDIVVLPYTSVTGSGLVQLAFGFNTPVVVSEIGALSEVVRDKETGLLVPPKNPHAIAKAVMSFFRESNRDAMIASIKRDKNKFAWEHLVKRIEEFGNKEP